MSKAMAKQDPVKNPVKAIKSEGKKVAKEAAFSPLMDRLTRLGYAVKGLLYVGIGLISIAGALGKSSTPADQLGAIGEFRKLPAAEPVLWLILIGLASYSLWGVIRAVLDPFHKGTDMEGLLTRGGYLVSAATYASFVVPTYQMLNGIRHKSSTSGTVEMVSKVMSMPMGRWLIGIVGLAAIAAGIYQIYSAIKMDFDQRFKPYAMSADQLRIAKQMGRFGTAARGLVFSLTGFFLVLAAYRSSPGSARGFDGALDYLAKQPYGIYLLVFVALGLIAFGVYSLMSAAWFKFKQ